VSVDRPREVLSADTDHTEIDAAIDRIRERAAERRLGGAYPPGMEDQLDRHYRGLVAVLAAEHTALRQSANELRNLPPLGRNQIQYTSRTRAGQVFHRVWGKLSSRQTEGILTQVRDYANVVNQTIARMTDVVETFASEGPPNTERRLATLADRLALLEQVAARLDEIEFQLGIKPGGESDLSG